MCVTLLTQCRAWGTGSPASAHGSIFVCVACGLCCSTEHHFYLYLAGKALTARVAWLEEGQTAEAESAAASAASPCRLAPPGSSGLPLPAEAAKQDAVTAAGLSLRRSQQPQQCQSERQCRQSAARGADTLHCRVWSFTGSGRAAWNHLCCL